MIYIYQNETNKIITRFSDRRQRSDSYFLWKIENYITKNITYYITEDISAVNCAYNLFELTDNKLTGSSVGGVNVDLDLEPGHNDYTVYETTELSIDEQYIIGEIEKDIMYVQIIRDVNTNNSQSKNIYY